LAAIRYLPAVFAAIYTVVEYIWKRLLRIPVSYPGGEILKPRSSAHPSRPSTKTIVTERKLAQRSHQSVCQMDLR
jgi:hypothetical protein